jgi:hypothetical protein
MSFFTGLIMVAAGNLQVGAENNKIEKSLMKDI